MEVFLEAELAAGQPEERELFSSQVRVPLRKTRIDRYGNIESVFVVGERDGFWLVYEEVEDGFEWCQPDEDGVIRLRSFGQFTLSEAMNNLPFKN